MAALGQIRPGRQAGHAGALLLANGATRRFDRLVNNTPTTHESYGPLLGRLPPSLAGHLEPAARLLVSNIRAKLAWFTGGLLFTTILILSVFNLQQQSGILTESYEREAAISRTYISSLVLELDNIAQSLIHIEQFRIRLTRQRAALSKYRTVRTYTHKKQVSLFGFKTSLFGALGEKSVRRSHETYYSEYLSDDDIKTLERRTRARLESSPEAVVSDRTFYGLQALAKKFVEADEETREVRRRVNELRTSLEEARAKAAKEAGGKKQEAPATSPPGPSSPKGNGAKEAKAPKDPLKELEEELTKASKASHEQRFALDRGIAELLAPSQRKKILELGLDLGRFRTQTFPLSAIVPGQSSEPTLDTSIFDRTSALNGDLKEPRLQQDLEQALQALSDDLGSQKETRPLEFKFKGMELQVLYSAHFRNPGSTRRARNLEQIRKAQKKWETYLVADSATLKEIASVTANIEARVEVLRQRRLPPYKDSTFRGLYKQYEQIIAKRALAYEEFLKTTPPTDAQDPEIVDALGYLRESALEDRLLLRFEQDMLGYKRYLESKSARDAQRKRWRELRNWIYAGASETPPAALKALFPDGTIANSRTEAEQYLWKLDSTPLLAPDHEDVANLVLLENFGGVIRTFVDRTAGLAAISTNSTRAVLSALLITSLAILLAVFISGFSVQKIKRIIRSAQQVGQGDLDIRFEDGGRDEFGTLTVALNQMVGGLHEREKIKGILGSMVDPVVIGEAMKDLAALKRGTEKPVTAFFSDVAGFSSISEKLNSVELAAVLNEYLSAMTIILKEHEGVLDKYIGDAIVGIFNAPVDVSQHSLKAVKASLRMQDRLRELRAAWTKDHLYIPEVRDMQFRIGLNTGPAKVGFMGTDALASYTMMGDTVNLAARLEAAGKDYGVTILASKAVFDAVENQVFARKLDLVRVKGKAEPIVIYEIISDAGDLPRGITDATHLYEEGFELYLKRDWSGAMKKLTESQKIRGREDKAAKMLIQRCEDYHRRAPADDWDGVFTRDHK